MKNKDFSVILPCYNESKNLPHVVESFAKFWPEYNFELILVNNGSTDDSAYILKELQELHKDFIRIVSIEKNIGYGYGIYTGLKEARSQVISYTHADIQTPPEDVIKAYDLWKQKNSNEILVKGLRVNRRPDELFLTNSLAKVVEVILGYSMRDVNGQPKMFSKRFLDEMKDPAFDFSFDVYVLYMAKRLNYTLVTFPVDFGLRIHGHSNWGAGIVSKYKTIIKYFISINKFALKNFKDKRNLFHQAGKFLAAGILTNAVTYSLFFMLFRLVHLYYVFSSVAGFLAGFLTGFVVNRSWTFSAGNGNAHHHLAKFFIVNMISLGFYVITITFCTEILNIIPEISQIITMAVSTVINFSGSKFWAFKIKDE
ncbi:glycosyltransferase [bacterium]